jgi:hypothetical protein
MSDPGALAATRRAGVPCREKIRPAKEAAMDIGQPKRIIEVEPVSLPLPEAIPAPDPQPASVPEHAEPTR